MAGLKTIDLVSVLSKFTSTISCLKFPTRTPASRFLTGNNQGCWRMGCLMYTCSCPENANSYKPLFSNTFHQIYSKNRIKLSGQLDFKRPIGRSPAKAISTSVTCSSEQEKDCTSPSNETSENTPKLNGPTLFECSCPQAALRWWIGAFSKRGVPEAEVSAEFLVAHALGFKQLHELTSPVLERLLTQAQLDEINKLCAKRLERVPVQYIVGDWDFRDITLIVRPPVFIPRPETEMLIDIILGHYLKEKGLHFLEIGCGSGAITVSLLKELPLAHVTTVDCSDEAVQLTTENAERLGVRDRLTVHCAAFTSDLPSCLQGKLGSFDAIVSNPPYIPSHDMQDLAPEIKLYEDVGALCGGLDGMDLIKDIVGNTRYLLKPGGSIWLETDCRHPEAIEEWLGKNQRTGVEFVRTFQDYHYRPRFSQLRYQPSQPNSFTRSKCQPEQ